MDSLSNRRLNFLFLALVSLLAFCKQPNYKSTTNKTHSVEVTYKDSSLILKTVKCYFNEDWGIFRDDTKLYLVSDTERHIYIERVFFNDEKTKMISWVGKKIRNAPSRQKYSTVDISNRICPTGGNNIYNYYVLIGFKDESDTWKLYPLEDFQLTCYNSPRSAIISLEDHFFHKMKNVKMWHVVQSGNDKGKLEMKAYDYNLSDNDFWRNCWLWQKDTVGSDGLYSFQVKSYGFGLVDKCLKCATPVTLPSICDADLIKSKNMP